MTTKQSFQFTRLFTSAFGLPDSSVVFIDGGPDPLYDFWSRVKVQGLRDHCIVVFLNAPKGQLWADLSCYPGLMIGSGYVMEFNTTTNPGVKPSQKGLFLRR